MLRVPWDGSYISLIPVCPLATGTVFEHSRCSNHIWGINLFTLAQASCFATFTVWGSLTTYKRNGGNIYYTSSPCAELELSVTAGQGPTLKHAPEAQTRAL